MINVFVEFLKKIKQTNLNNFKINIYWNIVLKSSMSSLNFVVFSSFKQLQTDSFLQYIQSRRRFFSRFLAQTQILRNRKIKRKKSSSNQLMKN